jgi:hypothetical protein
MYLIALLCIRRRASGQKHSTAVPRFSSTSIASDIVQRRQLSCSEPTYSVAEAVALACVLHFPVCGPVVEVCEAAAVEVASGDAVVDGSGSA